MQELIDKEKVQTEIALIAKCLAKSDAQKAIIGRILFMIDNMHTIEPEVRHGQWLDGTSRGSYSIYCSYCGSHKETICPSDYCPNCGARMDATDTNVGGKGGNQK